MSLHKLVSILLRKTFSQIASRKRQVSRDYFRLFIRDGKSRGHLNFLFFLSAGLEPDPYPFCPDPSTIVLIRIRVVRIRIRVVRIRIHVVWIRIHVVQIRQ